MLILIPDRMHAGIAKAMVSIAHTLHKRSTMDAPAAAYALANLTGIYPRSTAEDVARMEALDPRNVSRALGTATPDSIARR